MPLVQPYLEWEIKFNEQYLKGSLQQFVPFAPFYDICVRNRIKVTVNQMRALAAGKEHRHPDDRGLMFVFEEDPGEKPEDKVIPPAIAKVFLLNKYEQLGNETLVPDRKGCTGFLSKEEIDKMFPELADLASKAE